MNRSLAIPVVLVVVALIVGVLVGGITGGSVRTVERTLPAHTVTVVHTRTIHVRAPVQQHGTTVINEPAETETEEGEGEGE